MKTILITGISKGIGKALAQKFLKEGHSVIGTFFSGEIDFAHEHLKAYHLDLSKPESIKECVQAISDSGAKIDILINNAGGLFDDEKAELHIDLLRKTLEVNLIGTADFTEKILTSITKEGHIVFIASSAGSLTETDYKTHSHHPNQYPAYKISKAALNMYMRTLAMRLEHEERNITVSSVHPGWVKTEMGGDEAPMTPEEAAGHIYTLAISKPETGQFWFKGNKYPW
jgi:NAD(P)-dependent dehydrogenase (short-subunit alcohol dehydrogenase family)